MVYSGKLSDATTFRIGTIRHVFLEDFRDLIANVGEVVETLGIRLG